MSNTPTHSIPELLAPAGDFDAACAALHYGADAVYTGLPRFSARADATNQSPEELRRLVAHAHAQTRPRHVYVALNTLAKERDLSGVIETLEELDDIGVDAVLVQDLGIARIARRCFPRLRLHASTQLAIHNLDGARSLAELGFRRVVLARELTLREGARIGRESGIEVELFVHGALCYSYSGLCLFSSHQSGRSGNRGRCAYCCREAFALAPRDGTSTPPTAFPFSMRDLALAPLLPEQAEHAIVSLKIEGRMKNAFYVGCVTDYYRRKLDGTLLPEQETALVQDLQTIFSRPWTQLYANGPETPAAAIIDAVTVGHRGAVVGEVQAITRDSRSSRWLRFQTSRALEKHDGLQIVLPRGGKPFGFAVDELRRVGNPRLEISVPAGSVIEVRLPPAEEPQEIQPGTAVYCSASQDVRRRYQVQLPRPGDCRLTHPMHVQATLRPDGLTLTASTPDQISATVTTPLRLTPARQTGQTAVAIRRALERAGDTPWQINTLTVDDPQGLFVPASVLNETRRQLLDALTTRHEEARQARRTAAEQSFAVDQASVHAPVSQPRWAVKLDLSAPALAALADADEIILHLGHLPIATIRAQLAAWEALVPRTRLRLALPLLTRQQEEDAQHETIAALLAEGWQRWECADLGGWKMLQDAKHAPLDLTADWSCYGLNHVAREQLAELGFQRSVASPEDTQENLLALAACAQPAIEVLAWQQPPLFLSETPPQASTGEQPPWTWVNRRGQRIVTHNLDNRWVTVAETPFCLAAHLPVLQRHGVTWFRADFLWSPPTTVRMATIWNELRAGPTPEPAHQGNYLRGLA